MPGDDASRNLLFGLVGVRNHLIQTGELTCALRDWLDRGKIGPIGPILVEQGVIDNDELQVLDRLVERLIARCGGALSTCLAELGPPSPGLAAWLLAQPDIDLKLVFERNPAATLNADLAPAGSTNEESGASRPISNSTVVWGPTTIENGRDLDLTWDEPETPYGHYTILKSIAKGGLGEVFVARDEGLNREVALKVIQSRLMKHALCRARFLIEAEITGILEHPGIVPVYALGHCEDGRPFYSMRLIHGQSFQEAIRWFHEEPDPEARSRTLLKLLRHFIDVCNVVAYAHSRGVIHRDVKPSNVMLGRYGETLLVDWGLAKRVDPSGSVEDREEWGEAAIELVAGSGVTPTAIGATVGTPRFMSPEQALGDTPRIGPRCDVYGLGATLYCLVAGQEPLEDVKDLQKVLERVVRGAIPPPRSFRHDASSTLESICLKAMAVRPEDRYASARALADDIEQWLADWPTSVPERLGRRLGRWERRHRLLIRIGGAALLLLTVLAVLAALYLNAP